MELCIPSTKNVAGNNIIELPEACDGTESAACNALSVRADCTCTPATCGNGVKEGSAEACDGADNGGCAELPCLPRRRSCTPPSW